MTVELAIQWLQKHRAILNLRGVSNAIRLDYTMLIKAVDNKTDAYGYKVRFPERCLPRLQDMIRSLAVHAQ